MTRTIALLGLAAVAAGCASTPSQGPGTQYSTLHVTSTPEQARLMMSGSEDGPWEPFREDEGRHVAPVTMEIPEGQFFWLKAVHEGYEDSAPRFVRAEGEAVNVAFDLEPKTAPPPSPVRAALRITSEPAQARILVAGTKSGRYEPWPEEAMAHYTPLEVQVDAGQAFWVKVRKEGYRTSQPELVRVREGEPIELHVELDPLPEPKNEPAPRQPQYEVTAQGYAVIQEDVGRARKAAIANALSTAVQEKYGAVIRARSVSENYILQAHHVEAQVSGRYSGYTVLDEGQANGLYHVTLGVRFGDEQAPAADLGGLRYLVGGVESAEVDGAELESSEALDAVAEGLRRAGALVKRASNGSEDPGALAKQGVDQFAEVAVHVDAQARLYDAFGSFYAYQAELRYRLMDPMSRTELATGRIEAKNPERLLDAEQAARAALRAAGQAASREIAERVSNEARDAAPHSLFVRGLARQGDVDRLVRELDTNATIKDARLVAMEPGVCEVQVFTPLRDRSAVGSIVAGLRNTDLAIEDSDPYTTVARSR